MNPVGAVPIGNCESRTRHAAIVASDTRAGRTVDGCSFAGFPIRAFIGSESLDAFDTIDKLFAACITVASFCRFRVDWTLRLGSFFVLGWASFRRQGRDGFVFRLHVVRFELPDALPRKRGVR